MAQFVTAVIWWVAVWTAWHQAEAKGRNRWAWTVGAGLIPLVALIVWALPTRVRAT